VVQHADIDHTGLPGIPGGSGSASYDKLTADETGATTATLQNTSLSFAVTNGTYYMFRFYVVWRSTSTTVGIKIALTFPAVTAFAAIARLPIQTGSAGTSGGELQGSLTSSGEFIIVTASAAANTDYLGVIEGTILPSADGTLLLQYAAETTGATVTVKRGSTAELITV